VKDTRCHADCAICCLSACSWQALRPRDLAGRAAESVRSSSRLQLWCVPNMLANFNHL
jgi:hypothetical protein